MIHVLGQGDESMFLVDTATTPRLGLWFKGTHHQFSSVFLVIGAFVGNPDNRHVARQRVDRFRNNVEMFTGMKRD